MSETEIYNPQGNQILKKAYIAQYFYFLISNIKIHCPILENNRGNILIIHMIEGENKGGKKRLLIAKLNSVTSSCQQEEEEVLSCQAPKKIPSETFSHAPKIVKVA